MKLKHGKKYEAADGTVYKVERFGNFGTFHVSDDTPDHWLSDGRGYKLSDGSGFETPDLIRRHYTKPKPADKLGLQPGDVVHLVAWEDGRKNLLGEVGEFKGTCFLRRDGVCLFPDIILEKGRRPLFTIVSRASWPK